MPVDVILHANDMLILAGYRCALYCLLYSFGTKEWKEEIIFLFNDALDTFYLSLYSVVHMVKNHSDREEIRCCHYIWVTIFD